MSGGLDTVPRELFDRTPERRLDVCAALLARLPVVSAESWCTAVTRLLYVLTIDLPEDEIRERWHDIERVAPPEYIEGVAAAIEEGAR